MVGGRRAITLARLENAANVGRRRCEPKAVSSREMNIVVLFYRIGPYHFARLRSAAESLRVTAVEYSNVDPFYAWDEVVGRDRFARVTLFPGAPVEQQSVGSVLARVGAVLSDVRPQVVAVPGWGDRCALAALRWCCEEGVPAVVMSESTPWDEDRKGWKEAVKRQIVRCFAAGIGGGTSHAQYLENLGLPRERIFSGYDAVDNHYFAAGAAEIERQKAESRNQYGLPKLYFLASARFIEKKNLARLVEAYARYRELALQAQSAIPRVKGPTFHSSSGCANDGPWDLVLLGDGHLRQALEAQIADLNLHDHVHLPGFKQYPDLPAYYSLARVFIHASTTEQWGLVVNEAMACGLPVLISRQCGCAADLVQEGRNGFAFDPLDVAALAQLMVKVSALGFPLSQFGAASREIIARWGPEAFASGLKQAVASAVKAGPPKVSLAQRFLLRALMQR